jgi:hypothetical protein
VELDFLQAALAPVPAPLEAAFAAARAPVLDRAAGAAEDGADPLAGTRLERWLNESGDASSRAPAPAPSPRAGRMAERLAAAARARGAAAVATARLNVACFREGKPRR